MKPAAILALLALACGGEQPARVVAASATPKPPAPETLEDPPYALDSVFKPETHRGAPAPPPTDARLLRDVVVANDGGDAYAHLGESVAIDGDVAVAGAPYAEAGSKTDAGIAYVFVREDDRWRTAARLVPPRRAPYDRFGASVAVAGDRIVVCADRHDGVAADAGAAFVFNRDGGAWTYASTIAPRSLTAAAAFGYSAAMDGDTLVIGAPGAAEVYVFDDGRETILRPRASVRASGFGHSVAIDGDTILVGANTTSEPLLLGGAAYVFRRSGNDWQLETELRSPHDEALARFGTAVAVRGDVALIGASRATVGSSTRAGAAFVFEKRAATWTPVATLTNDPHRSDEEFGRALALLPNAAVVGSQFGDAAGLNTGGAQLYVRENGRWIRKSAVLADDRSSIAEFAFAIAAGEREVIIGAPRRNTTATATGGAYIFDPGGLR